MIRSPRRPRLLVTAVVLWVIALAPSTAASVTATWGVGTKAILPAGRTAVPNAEVGVGSVSCPSVGNCTAVGRYTDSLGGQRAVLLKESAGTWAPGIEPSLPAAAASSSEVTLASVSCASVGNCSATGAYIDAHGSHGLLFTESAGTWSTGVGAVMAPGVDASLGVSLGQVSCASAGNCSAVGDYGGSGLRQGLLLTESAGRWNPGVAARLPAGVNTSHPDVFVNAVSCDSAGNCSAVGDYTGDSGLRQGVMLSTRTASLIVEIKTARALVGHGRTKITLACSGGAATSACRGTLSLSIDDRVHNGQMMSVLAYARYTLASGRSRSVGLQLSRARLRLLADAPHHRLRAHVRATLTGGHSALGPIILQL